MSWMELDLVLTGCCVRPLSGKWIYISRERPAGKREWERGLWMLRRWRRGVWVQIERRGFPASLRRNPKQLIGTFVCSSRPLTRWELRSKYVTCWLPREGKLKVHWYRQDDSLLIFYCFETRNEAKRNIKWNMLLFWSWNETKWNENCVVTQNVNFSTNFRKEFICAGHLLAFFLQ